LTRNDLSRRDFVLSTTAGLVAVRPRAVTAADVVSRLREKLGVPWRETSVDGFKAGDPATTITGVAVTAMATLDILRRAAASGRNLVISQEPTFYAANDTPGARATDPIYLAKKAFIDEKNLVIWRFTDHWQARRPSELATALAETLAWTSYRVRDSELIYNVPQTTLADLTTTVRQRLGIRGGIRVVGRSDMIVRTVYLSPGTTDMSNAIRNLPKADVIVAGEPREWEAVPYVFDSWSTGQPKGMLVLGRIASTEPSVRACAAWLKTFVPEVPVEAMAVGDPYWSPLK
jgi:putative NIF3 family GTP cyclohydrolase 1 type 2